MPLYEYKCSHCEKVHEVMQKFSDGPLAECPDCQGPVTKLISLGSFALKGTGWYTTDYKRPSAGSKPAENNPAVAASTQDAPAAGAGASNASKDASTSPTSGAAAPTSSGGGASISAPASSGKNAGAPQ